MPEPKHTPNPISAEPVDDRHERFLRLYSLNQRQLHGYIGTFIYSADDVCEVAQETSVILWRKFETFNPSGSFLAWACGIARFEVFRYLRTKRNVPLPLESQLLAQISDEREKMQAELESRHEALDVCLSKLREKDRHLIWRCYSESISIKSIAEEMGRPVNSVYKSLGRIRNTLLICINSTLGLGGTR
ncbi:MAG: sigma-70 family RNA polymerase sigma factor [Phycisphaerales bacterium JB063]